MANIANTNLRDATDTVRETSQEVKERASRAFNQASDVASDFYDEARSWLQGNYGKALGGTAIVLCIGLIGYLVGRNVDKPDFNV